MRRIVPHLVGTIAQNFDLLLKIYGLQKGAQAKAESVNSGIPFIQGRITRYSRSSGNYAVPQKGLSQVALTRPAAIGGITQPSKSEVPCNGVEQGNDNREVGHFRLVGDVE